jgi:cation diffusion facilitator CzcD-associated flavoprotein CzcO
MRFLRSPAVHHLDVDPFGLLQWAGKRADRRGRGLFAPPYDRPSLALFNAHADMVIERYGLAARHVQDRVVAIRPRGDGVDLDLAASGTLRAARVILAVGASEAPEWPAWAVGLGARVQHVFGDGVAVEEEPGHTVVIGGGISASQVAVRLAEAGHPTTVLARHAPREHQFDADPGWLGPRHMAAFDADRCEIRRRQFIQRARHRGSVPPDVLRAVERARASGRLVWRVGEVVDARPGDRELALETTAGALRADRVLLGTGFQRGRPGGALVDALVTEHGLPCAACGFPRVDATLRWHPRVMVSGPLAELELGPVARNISGGRRAADRILAAA